MDRHTAQAGFVHHELLELMERPRLQYRTLRPASPDPRLNTPQIFQGNLTLRAFGRRHKPFGDHMVGMRGKAVFLSRQLPQAAASPFRALPLEFGSQAPMPKAHALNRLAAVDRAVAVNGDVRHAQVNAQRALDVEWCGFFHVADGQQVELTVDQARSVSPLRVASSSRCRAPVTNRIDCRPSSVQIDTDGSCMFHDRMRSS